MCVFIATTVCVTLQVQGAFDITRKHKNEMSTSIRGKDVQNLLPLFKFCYGCMNIPKKFI